MSSRARSAASRPPAVNPEHLRWIAAGGYNSVTKTELAIEARAAGDVLAWMKTAAQEHITTSRRYDLEPSSWALIIVSMTTTGDS